MIPTNERFVKAFMNERKLKFKNGLAKCGDVYYYRFSHKGQIYQASTGCSKWADAKEVLAELKTSRAKESHGLIKCREVPTFRDAVSLWYDKRKGKRSDLYLDTAKRQLELHVLPKLGNIRCNLLTSEVVGVVLDDYLHGQNRQYEQKNHNLGGYNTLASWISAVLGNLVPDYMEAAPRIKLEKLQRRKKPFIPRTKIDEFLAEIDRTNNLHVSVAVRAMLYMGLRESEALGMKWEGVDWDESTYCPDKTKGKEAVSLPFPGDMKAWLKKAQADQGEDKSEWILPAEDGVPHRKQFSKKPIVRAGTKIGVRLTPHRLRGSYATLLAKQGHSAYVIKDVLRHKDIQTTMGYVEVGLEDMRKANHDLWDENKEA